MTSPAFSVHLTSWYKRQSKKLQKAHRDFEATEKSALAARSEDPYNRARRHHMKKLEGVASGEGQYRLSLGRPLALPLRHHRPSGGALLFAVCAGRIRISVPLELNRQ